MGSKIFVTVLMLILLGTQAHAQTGTIVVDSITGEPLTGAYILDRNSRVVGVTTHEGRFPQLTSDKFPVTVRFMGYAPVIIEVPEGDIIRMHEVMSQLPEVIVESRKNQVLHLIGYMREYSLLTTYSDTVFLFREKMVDFMLPNEKVKRFKGWTDPRLLRSKSYYHLRDASGVDTVSDNFPEHFSWSDWIGITKRMELPHGLKDLSAGTDTVKSRHGNAMMWRKSDERVYLDIDVLADTANYRFVPSLSGYFTSDMDFRRLNLRYIFDDVYSGRISAANLTSMSFSIESSGRGRNLRRILGSSDTPYVETYAEIYIIDKKYISVKEARQWERRALAYSDIDMYRSDDLPALSPYITNLMTRVENIDYDAIRIATEPNRRMVSQIPRPKRGFLYRLKSIFGL